MKQRVVVTGMGCLSPLGLTWPETRKTLLEKESRVQVQSGWDTIEGLQTQLGAGLPREPSPKYGRKKTRTMGRVALLATHATRAALEDAGLLDNENLKVPCGVAYGSTSGSPPFIQKYVKQIAVNRTLTGISPCEYMKFMSHTTAANLAQFFSIRGRMIPACSACTSGSQAIGLAYESIAFGKQDVMVAGGAEELHVLAATVFDIMYATSTRNDSPTQTPRPFDADRDGLVVGEGAATLVLESLEHARAREAKIYAEIVGFGTNCDGNHIVTPSPEGMRQVMKFALESAALEPQAIDYVNAHGTATEVGDIAESQATAAVFGKIPISSLKSYMGHTLGACGAIEAYCSIQMMLEDWLAPTLHLENVDSRCAELDYLRDVRDTQTTYIMNNNFAFGGVNTSLILKKWRP